MEIGGDKDIVLSFEAKCTDNIIHCDFHILPDDYNTYGEIGARYEKTANWERFVFKYKTLSDWGSGNSVIPVRLRIDFNGTTDGQIGTVWIRKAQIEYGNIDSSYSIPEADREYIAKQEAGNIASDKINNIQIGDTNLLDDSNKGWKNSDYLTARILLGDYRPKEGEECTIVIKGKSGAGKSSFDVYNSSDRNKVATIPTGDFNAEGIAIKTFNWRIANNNDRVLIYSVPGSVSAESEIEWVKLVSGNKTSLLWSPSLHDQQKTTIGSIQVGGENFILNGDLRYYKSGVNPGWDTTLNGDLESTRGWWGSGYNNGVPEPAVGYHAHLDINKFGYPVMAFINKNGQFGHAGRWMGFSEIILDKEKSFVPGELYTISMDIYSEDKDGLIQTGLRSYRTGQDAGFNSDGLADFVVKETNKWIRFEHTFTLDPQIDMRRDVSVYIYGFRGNEGSKYVKNISLQKGNKGSWARAQSDVGYDAENGIENGIENIQIGVRNLLSKSNIPATNGGYLITKYYYTEPLVVGETYTMVFSGKVDGPGKILAYTDSGSTQIIFGLGTNKDAVYKKTFVYKKITGAASYNYCAFFYYPSGSTGTATINWAIVVKGNKAPDTWIEAQEDIDARIKAIEVSNENVEYLNKVFGKDSTIINGGVVLSSIIGVKNSSGIITAGIVNGEDPKAKGLMMFAGASSAAAMGSAPFRVMSDGAMYASKGFIGGFTISSSSLTAGSSNSSQMLLSSNLIRFTESTYSSVYIGANSYPGSIGGAAYGPMRIGLSKSTTNAANIGINIDVTGSSGGTDSSADYGNHALYIPNGDICGFRLRQRRINGNTTITNMDSVILCINSSYAIVYLPSTPNEEQIFLIRRCNEYVSINSGNRNIDTANGNVLDLRNWGDVILLMYDKVNNIWRANWISK